MVKYKFTSFADCHINSLGLVIKYIHEGVLLHSPLYESIPLLAIANREFKNNHFALTLNNAKIVLIRLGDHLLPSSDTRAEVLIGDRVIIGSVFDRTYYKMLANQFVYGAADDQSIEIDTRQFPEIHIKEIEFFGGGRANYGHFIFDYLPNLLLNQNKVVSYLRAESSQDSILDSYGVTTRIGISYSKSVVLCVERLTINSVFPYSEIGGLLNQFTTSELNARKELKLAIFKKAGNGSRISNILEVEDILEANGYQVIDPLSISFLSLKEKVSHCVSLIVSQDASSANALFAPSDARVVLLINDAYLRSERLDLQLSLIGLTSIKRLSIVSGPQIEQWVPGWAKFHVPIDELEAEVARQN